MFIIHVERQTVLRIIRRFSFDFFDVDRFKHFSLHEPDDIGPPARRDGTMSKIFSLGKDKAHCCVRVAYV